MDSPDLIDERLRFPFFSDRLHPYDCSVPVSAPKLMLVSPSVDETAKKFRISNSKSLQYISEGVQKCFSSSKDVHVAVFRVPCLQVQGGPKLELLARARGAGAAVVLLLAGSPRQPPRPPMGDAVPDWVQLAQKCHGERLSWQ